MDSFDKKINELYNQPEQDLPNDLSWDHMEDGIYSRMDNKKSNRKALWFWISGGLIAIAIIIGSVLIVNANRKNTNFATNNTPEKSNIPSPKLRPDATIPVNESPSVATNIKIDSDKNTVTTNQNISSKKSNVLKQSNTKSKSKKLIASQFNTIESELTVSESTTILNNPLPTNNKENKINYTPSDNIEKNINVINTSPLVKSRTAINVNQIATLNDSKLDSHREIPESNFKNIIIDSTPRIIENGRNTKYAFSFLGGTSLHSGFNIKSSDYTNSLPGYSIRLGLSAEKENGWGYEIGIGHALLVDNFDLDITDTVPEHKENIVVSELTNALTGKTSNVMGNANRDFSRTRRELNYNTINLVSLDAAIYKRINLSNRWSILPSIGIQYDRVLGIEGKSLDVANDPLYNTREVFTFDSNTSKVNKNLFSARLGIGIDYAVTHRLSLSARASSALSFSNLYDNSNRLNTTYIQGGLTIRL